MANPSQTNDYRKMVEQNNSKNMPTMESAREIRIRNAEKQNTATINYAVTNVNKLAGEDRVTIPESIFVKYFLPLFAMEVGMFPPTAYQEWMKISKNGMVPVVVVSEAGDDVVTVPPRYSRSLINIRTKRDRVSVSDAMMTFSDLAASSPIRAMNYFNNVIHPNTKAGDKRSEAINVYNEAMDKVLIHYGKKTGHSTGKGSNLSVEHEKTKTVYAQDDML